MNWFEIDNVEELDSPSILLYKDHLLHNLSKMIDMVGKDTSKLMPHIKTNKMPKVIEHMITLGIRNFKASTIAEAEIAAREGANYVLIAHQLVGPKIHRFSTLIEVFPNTIFSTIIDTIDSLERLNKEASEKGRSINIFIDINNGMNRSGIELGFGLNTLIEQLPLFPFINFKGLHVYDGHLRDTDFQKRKNKVEHGFEPITALFTKLKENYPNIELISGGTPSFTSHLDNDDRICSPGTCVLWDWGYKEKLVEQEFKYAALLLCRVISKPKKGIVTIDLGHKSVSAENVIDNRVKFLNLENYTILSQSEEHGVLEVQDWDAMQVGDVIYGVPYHICPTINLYDEVSVITDRKKTEYWDITARKRKISI